MLFKKYLLIIVEDRVIKDRIMISMKRNIPRNTPSYVINCKWCMLGGGLCSKLITNPGSIRKSSTISNYCMKYRMKYYVSEKDNSI